MIVAGALTADLEFLSTFYGHQGASAKFPCIFCLAKRAELNSMFLPGCDDAPK